MDENGTYSWPGNEPQKPPKKPFSFKKLGRIFITVLVILLALSILGTCFYTVDDKQQAVVTTFGKVTDVTDAGVHFKLPLGIQQVHKVDVNVYQKIELGYSTDPYAYDTDNTNSTMITGDYNIVDVVFLLLFLF